MRITGVCTGKKLRTVLATWKVTYKHCFCYLLAVVSRMACVSREKLTTAKYRAKLLKKVGILNIFIPVVMF